MIVILLLASALGIMFSTDRGSKFLLDRVLERQTFIVYEYEGGNLLRGITLRNILVKVKQVDVKLTAPRLLWDGGQYCKRTAFELCRRA